MGRLANSSNTMSGQYEHTRGAGGVEGGESDVHLTCHPNQQTL